MFLVVAFLVAFAVELRHFLVAVSCQTTHFLVAAGGHLRARNSMARTKGATDKGERRRRKSTKVELDARAHKKAEEAERKRAREHAAAAGAKRKFLRGMQPTAVGNGEAADEHGTRHESSGGASADDRDRGVADGDSRSSGAGGAGSNGTHPRRGEDDAEEQTERQAERQEARPADVEAELDDEDQLEGSDGVTSVMGAYLKAVFERLHSETIGEASRNALEAKWLLDMLNEEGANFWLPAARARSVCTKLGLEYGEPAYYRDIKVWLPDEQWGPEAMPPCVVCGSAKEVGVHAFADNHFGRRISSVCGHYFVMTRRYKCHCCERKAKAAKLAAEAAGLRVEVDEETVTVLATRGAVATIEAPGEWTAPDGCRPAKLKPTATRCLVKVTKVLAPSLVVPAVKCDGKPLSLSDLGEPPFLVMLPLGMIKVHVDSSHVRTTADRTASSAAAPEAAATAPSAPAPSSPAISSPPTSDDDADDPEQQLSPITQRQNAAAHAAAHTAAAAAAAANAEPGYTGGGDNDGDGDDPDVSSDDVEMLRAAAVAAAAGDWKALDGLLDPAPEKSTQLLESSSRPGSLRVRLL